VLPDYAYTCGTRRRKFEDSCQPIYAMDAQLPTYQLLLRKVAIIGTLTKRQPTIAAGEEP
jgi:hypothetical protein